MIMVLCSFTAPSTSTMRIVHLRSHQEIICFMQSSSSIRFLDGGLCFLAINARTIKKSACSHK